jgi:hypothetical protein
MILLIVTPATIRSAPTTIFPSQLDTSNPIHFAFQCLSLASCFAYMESRLKLTTSIFYCHQCTIPLLSRIVPDTFLTALTDSFQNIWIRFGIAIASTLTSLVDILHYHSLCWTTFTHKKSQAATVLTLAMPVLKISQLAVLTQVLRHPQTLLRPPSKHSNMTSGLRGATRLACEHDDISILSDHL